LADPNSPAPVIHPPDTGLQRPERPSRFAPSDRPRDRPPAFGGSRERGGAPSRSGGPPRRKRPAPDRSGRPGRGRRPGWP
jgi:hypothetical protein